MKILKLIVLGMLIVGVTGCNSNGDKKPEYVEETKVVVDEAVSGDGAVVHPNYGGLYGACVDVFDKTFCPDSTDPDLAGSIDKEAKGKTMIKLGEDEMELIKKISVKIEAKEK